MIKRFYYDKQFRTYITKQSAEEEIKAYLIILFYISQKLTVFLHEKKHYFSQKLKRIQTGGKHNAGK